ncbi:MAG: 50S ribosomal protein L11 methyltransferase [Gammaproteobacteria bacterium]
MPWLEISLDLPPDEAPEGYEEALLAGGALSVTLRDAGDTPVLEPGVGETPLWPRTRVIGLFAGDTDINAVRRTVARLLGATAASQLSGNPLEDRDWSRAWLDRFKPMRFGTRLWVCPEAMEPPESGGVTLRLDPGLAFGTGTHPTTALCLEWLDAHPVEDYEVLDYGCGSGVLGIAAALLGARRVWAVDNDPQALIATADNAAKNRVHDRVLVRSPADLPSVQCDLLLANILAGPLIDLAPRLARDVRPGGAAVLSGILSSQAGQVGERYARWFAMGPPAVRDDWVRLEGVRK